MANAPDPKSITNARIARTEQYAEKVRQLFAATVNEIIAMNKTLPDTSSGIMYSFDGDSKKVQAKVELLLRRLHSVVTLAVQKGISIEWEQANAECDKLVKSAYGRDLLGSPIMKGWQKRNNAAKQAFINRSDNGMNLSDRVWQSCRQLRDEMEIAITVAIGEGQDAQSMSRNIRKYLNDPDLMFRRFQYQEKEPVLDDDGNAVLDKHGKPKMQPKLGKDGKPIIRKKWKKRIADPMRPGHYKWIDYDKDSYIPKGAGKNSRGVYRSAAKNAMRVARTETNIAYRRADHQRWQEMDFVLGQRVHLSRSHPKKDICDRLAGDYPKDFVFDGWHPQCFCYVTPILVDASEMQKANEAFLRGEKYTPKGQRVFDYPSEFKDYVRENEENIFDKQKSNPYFIDNNQSVVAKILRGDEFTEDDLPIVAVEEEEAEPKQLTIQEMAEIRHNMRTEAEENDIRERWKQHQEELRKTKLVADNVLKVAGNYGDVDFSALQSAIDDGNYTTMRQLAKDVAQQILAAKKFEQSISDIIPDANKWHRQFSQADLKTAYDKIQDKLNDISLKPLAEQEKALLKEMQYVSDPTYLKPHTIYPTWKVAQSAYIKRLDEVRYEIKVEDVKNSLSVVEAWLLTHTKGTKVASLLADAKSLIYAKADIYSIQNAASLCLAEHKKRLQEQARRDAAKAKKAGASITSSTFDADAYSQKRKDAAHWALTFKEANDKYHDSAVEYWKTATADEKEAFDGYTGGSGYITESLRAIKGHYYYYHSSGPRIQKHIDSMTKALNRCTFGYDFWIKRDDASWQVEYAFGISDLSAYRSNPSALVGRVGVDDSFLSCGSHKGARFTATCRKDVIYNIYCPKGTKGVYATPFSVCDVNGGSSGFDGVSKVSRSSENEIILQRGCKLRITKAEYNDSPSVVSRYGFPMWFIDVELLEQNPRDFTLEYESGDGWYCKY